MRYSLKSSNPQILKSSVPQFLKSSNPFNKFSAFNIFTASDGVEVDA